MLKKLPNKQFLSFLQDKSIKLWELKVKNVWKTINGYIYVVCSLKLLDESTLASGSFKEIQICNIDDRVFIKTLNGYD